MGDVLGDENFFTECSPIRSIGTIDDRCVRNPSRNVSVGIAVVTNSSISRYSCRGCEHDITIHSGRQSGGSVRFQKEADISGRGWRQVELYLGKNLVFIKSTIKINRV